MYLDSNPSGLPRNHDPSGMDATFEKEREIAVGATPAPRKQSRVDTRVQTRSVYNVISRTLAR